MLDKTLESPLDCKEIQPVHPKGISPEYSLEGLMLKLKLQYFGHLMWRTDLFQKTLMLGRLKVGEEGDDRRWDGLMASLTQWTWVWVGSGSWWRTGKPGVLQSMGLQRARHDWAIELNWTELNVECETISQIIIFYILHKTKYYILCVFTYGFLYNHSFKLNLN